MTTAGVDYRDGILHNSSRTAVQAAPWPRAATRRANSNGFDEVHRGAD
jgi:hypothetical protein